MKRTYLSTMLLIERLHRRFLDIIKVELERQGVEDINNVQTLILYNIGDETLTVGELTHRGYYLGSNVSYNVKKLVENGFLIQERSTHDKRSVKVRLSEKGQKLCAAIDAMHADTMQSLASQDFSEETLDATSASLHKLEECFSHLLWKATNYNS